MSSTGNFLTPRLQNNVPSGSVLTLNPALVPEGAYLLTGFIPLDFIIAVSQERQGKITIKNLGSLPAVWYELDNPYRPMNIVAVALLPGETISVKSVCGENDRRYLAATAFDVSRTTSDGMYLPVVLRIRLGISNDQKIQVEY